MVKRLRRYMRIDTMMMFNICNIWVELKKYKSRPHTFHK